MLTKTTIIAAIVSLTFACTSTENVSVGSSPVESVQVTKYETYVSAGQQLPLAQLTSINGEMINLQEQGKRKLVILFATWCSDSQRTIKQLLSSPILKQQDLTVVGIGREENAEDLHKFSEEYQVTFPLVTDENREIYKQFASAGIPRLVLVDENNMVVKMLFAEDPAVMEQINWDLPL
ncbi:MAG: TlpA family protein disulfide reductase [Alteromonadaceae bacterium]|nr:TlpA family protein disulfide reductase [Alteromonadaceae bacterium]